ncbi:MAG: InlB B-repeat-containing protein [Treponema sp.]|nr:InlB B-repeat-containing protein [Treponema sp.]
MNNSKKYNVKYIVHRALLAAAVVVGLGFAACKPPSDPNTGENGQGAVFHTVRFHSQNGVNARDVLVKSGKTAKQPANPAKAGHFFDGWYINAVEKSTEPFNFSTPITADITLYAHWTQGVTLSFDSDKGSTVDDVLVRPNATAKKPHDPTKDNFDFDGWFSNEARTDEYNFSTPVTVNITLYAKWVAAFMVRFVDALDESKIDKQPVRPGKHATEPSQKPSKNGYDFAGWFTEETGGVMFDFSALTTNDTDVHAQWDIKRFKVSFNTHGGTPATISEQTIGWGGNATEPPTKPTKGASYIFRGWYTEEESGVEFIFNDTPIKDNITLHAQWRDNELTVSFAMNGGTPQVQPKKVRYGEKASQPPQNFTKPNHDFGGWFSDAACTVPYGFNELVTDTITLYARWNIHTFTVSFHTDGGSIITPQTINHNEKVLKPTSDPTKAGHDFAGWFIEKEGGAPFNFDTPITKNTDIYARWIIKTFTVSFEMGGGMPQEHPQTMEWGKTARSPVGEPKKTGYEFLGWFNAASGG